MIELYRAIWRVSARRQLLLALLAVAIAALAAVPLAYQRAIVNGLAAGPGQETEAQLFRWGAEMLAVVLLSLGLKWGMNLFSGMTGERTIRLIRERILDVAYKNGARTPDSPEPGSLATMLSAEAEELGKFVGGAVAHPLVQFGTLVSVVGFIAASQPRLGFLALLVILPQALIVLDTQKRVNALVKQRVQLLRHGTGAASREDVSSAVEDMRRAFDAIVNVRRRVFLWKLSTKLALGVLNGVGSVGILMLGGWLVLKGRSDVGTVVAATAGLARLQQPWTELVAFYRQVSAVRVEFELLRTVDPRNR